MAHTQGSTFTGAIIEQLKAFNQREILSLYLSKASVPNALKPLFITTCKT